MRRNVEQLQIDVSPAPSAVGRWEREHEIEAYRKLMGDEAHERQRRLAEQAKECTCGNQAKADAEAKEIGVRPKKLFGWEHKTGCNSYTRRNPKLVPRISAKEQAARYEDNVNDLRDALARAREEGRLR